MAYRFRLYPDVSQSPMMATHCAHARAVWNLGLEQARVARQFGSYADQNLWDRQLAEARSTIDWLGLLLSEAMKRSRVVALGTKPAVASCAGVIANGVHDELLLLVWLAIRTHGPAVPLAEASTNSPSGLTPPISVMFR